MRNGNKIENSQNRKKKTKQKVESNGRVKPFSSLIKSLYQLQQQQQHIKRKIANRIMILNIIISVALFSFSKPVPLQLLLRQPQEYMENLLRFNEENKKRTS